MDNYYEKHYTKKDIILNKKIVRLTLVLLFLAFVIYFVK